MLKHQQFAEDLALLALGELDRDRAHDLILHLERCTSCREQYEQLVTEADLLDISSNGVVTPPIFESTLEIESDPEPARSTAVYRVRPRWWALAPVFAVAVLVLFCVLLWTENRDLRQEVRRIKAQVESGTGALQFELRAPASLDRPASLSDQAAPHAHVLYHRGEGKLLFLASHLPPLGKDRTYQLWMIPSSGAPITTGIFAPDESGTATLTRQSLSSQDEPTSFTVTVEPLGGSDTPSLPPIMSGN